jgi:NADH-quinone oxidoreductase subunit K
MIVPYSHVVVLAAALFMVGAVCAASRRSLIMVLLGVEIMINAAGIVLVAGSLRWGNLDGQAFVLLVLGVAAAEVAVGLALLVYSHRRTGTTDVDAYARMKG